MRINVGLGDGEALRGLRGLLRPGADLSPLMLAASEHVATAPTPKQEQHGTAFVVAGAARDDLMVDLRGVVEAAIADSEDARVLPAPPQ